MPSCAQLSGRHSVQLRPDPNSASETGGLHADGSSSAELDPPSPKPPVIGLGLQGTVEGITVGLNQIDVVLQIHQDPAQQLDQRLRLGWV